MKSKITLKRLQEMKRNGEKIVCLTAYDASFAHVMDEAGMEIILVGDSLGMVLHGNESTLKVTVADMIYHSHMVSQVSKNALVVTDMPFMSYATPAQALGNAARLMSEGGAEIVKLEGGQNILDIVHYLNKHNIPVCGHLGLQPQSVHKLGGYQVQGRDQNEAQAILQDARSLEEAGALLLVLECIPSNLAAKITRSVTIPTIGIGAGKHCDGQVLVLYDVIGLSAHTPRMAKNFLQENSSIQDAIHDYISSVKNGLFPGEENSFD